MGDHTVEESKQEVAAPEAAAVPDPTAALQKMLEFQQAEWNKAADQTRLAIAKQRGLLPKELPADATDAQKEVHTAKVKAIVAGIELEGDTIKYAKDKDGKPRMAFNRHGLMAMPHPRGRRKPHMTKAAQGVKSAALGIFRGLFQKHAAKLEAEAKTKGEAFNGVPVDDLAKLSAKATMAASHQVKESHRARRRRLRNESKLQRRINAGVLPGNTNRRAYTIN